MTGILPDNAGDPTVFISYERPDQRLVVGALKTDYFVRLQSAISFGGGGHAAIVDRHGQVIAHPDVTWRTGMRDISAVEPVQRMLAGETGVSRFYFPATRQEMIAGFTIAPETGWGVMIPQPMTELEARVRQVNRAVWSVVGVALLAAALLGWLFSRWLTTPLSRIGEATERFASGDYAARASALGCFHTREVANLASRFDSMADDVTSVTEAFRQSEERFRDFATIAADWLWETDLDQVYTYVSPPAAERASGASCELVGTPRYARALGRRGAESVARIQHHMDRHETFDDIELAVEGSRGEPTHLAVSGRPLRDSAGRVTAYRGVARDISARLQAEAQIRKAGRDERRRESQKLEAIGTLAGGIAHDFNNILGVILGYTELTARQRPDDSWVQQNLEAVHHAAERARSLVQQILTFSRKGEQEYSPVHLEEVVKQSLPLLRALLPSSITIRKRFRASPADVVLGNTTQIQQVLTNLATNAEHAMRGKGGSLEIGVESVTLEEDDASRPTDLTPGEYVRLSVSDSGYGMTTEVRERAFEPFFSTKGVNEGSGLGLAVVHGIVTGHHGAIELDSDTRTGTTFRLYFPALEAEAQVEATATTEPAQRRRSDRVLFVDDEISLVRLAKATLESLGYDAATTASSTEALALFRNAPDDFDVVVTDQTMPGLTGEKLIEEMRRIRADIPAILCTGFSHTVDAETADALGIDAFCMKPLVGRALDDAIQDVLARRRRTELEV